MLRVRNVTAAVLATVAISAVAAGSAWAAPSCSHWRVNPAFSADESDGLTVTFKLHQSGTHLSGTASFTQTHPDKNIFGESTASTTYGDIVPGASHFAGGRFTVRVQWTNDFTQTFSGSLWLVKAARGGTLSASLTGKTNGQVAVAPLSWHTRAESRAVKPLTCLAHDTVTH